MRKFLAIAVALAALASPLGGCAGSNLPNPITVLTGSVAQPITRNQVAALVQTEITALIPVRYYVKTLRDCAPGETWYSSGAKCGEPAVKAQMRSATAEAQKWRRELASFVKNNDQVNARVALSEYNRVMDILKSVPKAGG